MTAAPTNWHFENYLPQSLETVWNKIGKGLC